MLRVTICRTFCGCVCVWGGEGGGTEASATAVFEKIVCLHSWSSDNLTDSAIFYISFCGKYKKTNTGTWSWTTKCGHSAFSEYLDLENYKKIITLFLQCQGKCILNMSVICDFTHFTVEVASPGKTARHRARCGHYK